MLGPGNENSVQPTRNSNFESPTSAFTSSPDDLLEMLRKKNSNMFTKNFDIMNSNSVRSNQNLNELGGLDPSLADEVSGGPKISQPIDVQNRNFLVNEKNSYKPKGTNANYLGGISVLSDGLVQYKHGRLSMDTSGVVNSFLQDQHQSRNQISHPFNDKFKIQSNVSKPIVRATISNTLPGDNIELMINGRKLLDRANSRSNIVSGKNLEPAGKTIMSKQPVQIELSHDANKRKIINIKTIGKYNVTDNVRKRNSIVKPKQVS